MKTKKRFLMAALISGLGLIPAGLVTAQTFTTLHSFDPLTPAYTNMDGVFYNNIDGAAPDADLIVSGNTLYGTTYDGGNANAGTVFRLNTDGTGFTILHKFTQRSGSNYTNSDGAKPAAVLVLSGNTLFGTAAKGGSSGKGTLFAVNVNGTGFTNLHSFTAPDSVAGTNSDGAIPYAGLVLTNNTLYGTASGGGNWGNGTVFALNSDGSGFTTLHSFTTLPDPDYTNSDGADPEAGLVLSGNTLYGTTVGGGSSGKGTVFKVNRDGSGFTNLHSFSAGSDGANPFAGLILSDNTLYGTAQYGGSSPWYHGTVFKINTDGAGFTVLHSFTGYFGAGGTNSDGANPVAGLSLSGSTLYGTTYFGGISANGTLFALNTDGTRFTSLHSFAPSSGFWPNLTNIDGASMWGGLVLSGNTLYGATQQGSISGAGTVFSISLPLPQLTMTSYGANVVLTWPTSAPGISYAGFTLQSTTNLDSPAVWSTNSPPPVVVNGQNTVTNPITGAQQFYRLVQ